MKVMGVDQLDWIMQDGAYKKEYWGNFVIDPSGTGWIFSRDGKTVDSISSGIAGLLAEAIGRPVLPTLPDTPPEKDFIAPVLQETAHSVSEVLRLKDKFTVEEIISLRHEGIF